MYFRAVAFSSIVAALTLGLLPAGALAQAPAPVQAHQSMGLQASLVNILMTTDEVTAQIVVKNNTQSRIYVKDVVNNDDLGAYLGSGAHLQVKTVENMPACYNAMANCMNSYETDLSRLTYIEPGDDTGVSIKYGLPQGSPARDTVTFSLGLMARFAKDNSPPDDVGPAKAIIFHFNYVPIGQ